MGATHLAFAIEAAYWEKTDISTHVRKILGKFSPIRYGEAARTGDSTSEPQYKLQRKIRKLGRKYLTRTPTEKPR